MGLIHSMKLDGKKDIQSVKSGWSVLHAALLKANILTLYREMIKDVKQTQTIYLNIYSIYIYIYLLGAKELLK